MPIMAGMDALLGGLLIFILRLGDVSIGTLRTLYVVRGDRLRAVPLAFVESLIWIIAIARIMKDLSEGHVMNMLAYAGGYAAGVYVGITIERWIASGWVLVRIITRNDALTAAVRAADFGVTELHGEGRHGEQSVLFIVALRRRGNELLELVRSHDETAFVTVDPVNSAMGGYLPIAPRLEAGNATAVRK
jgi:uncharacterized protein YebE (UPF0316 family)